MDAEERNRRIVGLEHAYDENLRKFAVWNKWYLRANDELKAAKNDKDSYRIKMLEHWIEKISSECDGFVLLQEWTLKDIEKLRSLE